MVVCGVAGGVGTTAIAALAATAAPWVERDAHTTLIDVRGDVCDLLVGGPAPQGLAQLGDHPSLDDIERVVVSATVHTAEPQPSVRIVPRGDAAHDWVPAPAVVGRVAAELGERGHTVVIDAGTAAEATAAGLAGGDLGEAVVLVTGTAADHCARLREAAQSVDAATVVVVADGEGLRSFDDALAGGRYVTKFLRDPETGAWLDRRCEPPAPRYWWTALVDASQVCAYADWEHERRLNGRSQHAEMVSL